MLFEDYHCMIVGYHGTRLSVALEIVNRKRTFKFSRNQDDWLGHGIYFWEYAPQQAYWWAERRRKAQGWDEPIAILGSMIRLGFCFDLLDPYNVRSLKDLHEEYRETELAAGRAVPRNVRSHRKLDCAVLQYAFAVIKDPSGTRLVDSARGVYVLTDQRTRALPGSWISEGAHIQICVRNPACILGTWLHHPSDLESSHAFPTAEIAEDRRESEDRCGSAEVESDADVGSHPTAGRSEN